MSDVAPEIQFKAPAVGVRGRGRAVELVAIFGVAPALLALGPRWLASVAIQLGGLLCAVVLARDPTFARGQLLGVAAAREGLRPVLLRTLVVWSGLLLIAAIFARGPLFDFPRNHSRIWLAVMVLYPISAYAQEVMFRTFFFHRYRGLFARPGTLVLASGLLFGWAHIVVNNLVALPLAAVAGLLFARTYQRSRSTLLVALEHALYGDFVFSVGLGTLFYSTVRWIGTRSP
jgi:hypothetical protein